MAPEAEQLPANRQEPVDQPDTDTENGDANAADTNGTTVSFADSTNLADPRNSELVRPLVLQKQQADNLPGLILTDDFGGLDTSALNMRIEENPPPEGERGTVTKDSEGRVISVEYPNGKKREFGYDENGQLNRVVQPDGQVLVLKDGKWYDEKNLRNTDTGKPGMGGNGGTSSGGDATNQSSGGDATNQNTNPPTDQNGQPTGDAPVQQGDGNGMGNGNLGGSASKSPGEADFKNPVIQADGTFSWESQNGDRSVAYVDGTSSRFLKEGGSIWMDDQGRVTSTISAGGDNRRFTYGDDGNIATITENGRKYEVRDGELYFRDRPTGRKHPQVAPDGTYSVEDSKGSVIAKRMDGTSEIFNKDRSVVKKDKDGRITEIGYANGNVRTFEYDDNGTATYTNKDGTKVSGVTVRRDGTLEYKDKDGKLHTEFTSGNALVTERTAEELNEIAKKLHDDNHFWSNDENVRKTLAGLSTADRLALDKAYEDQYGETLTERLKKESANPLKRDNANEALKLMTDAQLKSAALERFSDPADLKRAMDAIADFQKRAAEQGVPAREIADAQEKAAKELSTNRLEPHEQLKELEKNLGKTAPSIDSVSNKYGVKYDEQVMPDGTKVRHYYVEGDKGAKLPVLDSATDNPIELERQLKEWRDKKMRSIEQNYNVEFSRDGQTDDPLGKRVDLRAPRIDELMALEKGFEHSQPSTSTQNGRPILVQFAVQPTSGNDAYVLGKNVGTPQEQQRILFEPLNRSFRGLQDTILHEWAHNAEHNLDQRNPAVTREFYEAQGYRNIKIKHPDGREEEQWQMKDKDGNYWAQGPGQWPFGNWTRVDDQGRPLRADGSLASGWDDKRVAKQSNDDMATNAAVTPADVYHPNPVENGAEAIRMFRGDEKSREDLFRKSPELYEATKKFDQADLDNDPHYGRNPDGTSKYIRLPDGTVGRNNEENRKRVADYEQTLRMPPAPRTPPPSSELPRERPKEEERIREHESQTPPPNETQQPSNEQYFPPNQQQIFDQSR